jgi:hypothetical protein
MMLDQVGQWNGHSIPTFYGGITMRSRTEARWATFMDLLGVGWHYEHEGFELPSGRYLPDFWVPSVGAYLEIKPSHFVPTMTRDGEDAPTRAWKLCNELSAATGKRVIMFLGSPDEQGPAMRERDPYQAASGHETGILFNGEGVDYPYCWCVCPACRKFGIEFDGRGGRVCGGRCDVPEKSYSWDDSQLIEAYDRVRWWRYQ